VDAAFAEIVLQSLLEVSAAGVEVGMAEGGVGDGELGDGAVGRAFEAVGGFFESFGHLIFADERADEA